MKKSCECGKLVIISILIAIAVFAVLVFVSLFLQRQGAGNECSKDSDCIKVQTSCCPCNMGGNEVCAGKNQAENLTAKNCAENLMCIALYNCKIESCSCVQGKCEAVPKQ